MARIGRDPATEPRSAPMRCTLDAAPARRVSACIASMRSRTSMPETGDAVVTRA